MGKNNKKEENNEENETKGAKQDKSVVLKAFIHCEGCSDKISKCLKGLEGVEHTAIDRDNNRVVVKGDVVKDPTKVLDRLKKKYSKNVELISPKPKPEKQKKEAEKKEQAKVKTVVLKVYLHCDGCVTDVKRKIEKMEGVVSVEVDKATSHVTVKGAMEPKELMEYLKKRLRKHAEIVKEDNQKEAKTERKNNEKSKEPIIMFTYPPQYSTQYLYPNQTFSDENVFACSIM